MALNFAAASLSRGRVTHNISEITRAGARPNIHAATGRFFKVSLGMHPGILFALLADLVEFLGGPALMVGPCLTRVAAAGVAVLMAVA